MPPDLARQFVSRHLCTALAVPLLWHTEILWRQYVFCATKWSAMFGDVLAQCLCSFWVAFSLCRRPPSAFSPVELGLCRARKTIPSWSRAVVLGHARAALLPTCLFYRDVQHLGAPLPLHWMHAVFVQHTHLHRCCTSRSRCCELSVPVVTYPLHNGGALLCLA